jgi:ABC-2 type transport system permease protein
MPIFDQGYQHWQGQLSGHAWRWLAIARHGVRIGLRGRIFRLALLLSFLPAIGLAVALCVWGLIERQSDFVAPIVQFLVSAHFLGPDVASDPRHYRIEVWTMCYNMFFSFELFLSMILVALVGPNLISQDLRFNALPLYLSRPLRRIDYLAGKLGVIAAFLGLAIIAPCLFTYALGLLFSLDLTIIRDTYGLLLASIAYGLVIIASSGMLILALSCLSRSSRWVALFWLCLWIVSGSASAILENIHQWQESQTLREEAAAERESTPEPQERKERVRQQISGRAERQALRDKLVAMQLEASKTDWRPLLSYTANLSRVGRQLLGTDDCVRKLSDLQPAEMRTQFLAMWSGPQYPWSWSAGVLAGIVGLSAWILSFSVRSLDRLR